MNVTTIRTAFKLLPVVLLLALAVGTAVHTAASNDPAARAVGRYQISATSNGDTSRVYKLDTRTGQLWERGNLVFTMQPMQVGNGCLEIPQEFKPAQKQQQ